MTTLAFAPKRHVPGARGFAVYVGTIDGRYLGDVIPVDERGGRVGPDVQRQLHEWDDYARGTVKPIPGAILRNRLPSGGRYRWIAIPAGASEPIGLIFPDREAAAGALEVRGR